MVNFEKAIDCCFLKEQNSANKISDFFIQRAYQEIEKGTLLTHLKLQKLLYYSYVWWLVLENKQLFDNRIEAWEHGPVIRQEWNRFKNYRNKPIKISEVESKIYDKKLAEFLEKIWQTYGKYDAFYLVNLTHSEQPWKNTFNQNIKQKQIISDGQIKSFYKKELFKNV